ncbi:MAG: hypothetical protein RL885_14475 [Planctomycetota bacterium]
MEPPSIDPIRLRALTSAQESATRAAKRPEPAGSSFESILAQVREKLEHLDPSKSGEPKPPSPKELARDLDGTLERVQTQFEDLMSIRSRLLEAYRLAKGPGPSDDARD